MPLTMTEIRAKYPDPMRLADAVDALKDSYPYDGPPPCYCVGGAFLLACGEPWHGLYADDISALEEDEHVEVDSEVTFPNEFANNLRAMNRNLDCRVHPVPAFWANGNSDMAGCYESAIIGANDDCVLNIGTNDSPTAIAVPDHFDLAWQLLDDALTYDPATFDVARELRLLKGGLMKLGGDPVYFDPDRPELVAYRARHIDRYLELLALTSETSPP